MKFDGKSLVTALAFMKEDVIAVLTVLAFLVVPVVVLLLVRAAKRRAAARRVSPREIDEVLRTPQHQAPDKLEEARRQNRVRIFPKCDCCGSRIVAGAVRASNGVFCSANCQRFDAHPGFCQSCLEATSSNYVGKMSTVNGCGTRFYGSADHCETCNSTIRTRYLTILWIPIIPLGRYRVLQVGPVHLLLRECKED